MLASRITLPRRLVSACRNRRNCSGVLPTISVPSSASLAPTSGALAALASSVLMRLARGAGMPAGPVRVALPDGGPVEGMALVEAFRGDLLVWLRINNGTIDRCHLRDASWFQWPLLEVAIEGNIVADFPLCNKSFNCSYSGHDL